MRVRGFVCHSFKNTPTGDFPGGPVVKTLLPMREPEFDSWLGN